MSQAATVFQEQCQTDAGLPCPFCGCDQLLDGSWYIDDGEVAAWKCSQCFAGAPKLAWNTRHAPTPAWHYPTHNLDLPNLPQPGETVVAYYREYWRDGGGVCGPIIITPVDKDGPPTVAGKSIYQPIVRWCRIPEGA